MQQMWYRDKTPRASTGPDDEQQEKLKVIQECMTRINSIGGLVLGKNRQGQIMALTSTTEEELKEKLIQVRLGSDKRTHKTWRNAAVYAMKHLSLYHGHHNIGNHKGWETASGTTRLKLQAPHYRTEPFCDNIILEFSREIGSQEPMAATTELLNWMGMVRHKRGSTKDSAISFHPSLIGKYHIKVSLANVSLLRLEVMRQIMDSSFAEPDIGNPEIFNSWWRSLEEALNNLKLYLPSEASTDVSKIVSKLNIQEAFKIKIKQHIKLTEFDITYDYAGCLDAEEMVRVAGALGHRVVTHRCGLNCVKLDVGLPGQSVPFLSRTYNKWLETWQQGFARSDDIACKCAFALNPSTTELVEMLNRPDVQKHGLTRNELTFISPNIPRIQDMIKCLNEHSKMLNKCLVSASLQDQLLDMERYVKRSILVFWPEVISAKLREHRQGEKRAIHETQQKEELAPKQPEGGLVRWMNKRTGKYNGVVLRTPMTGRASENSSWNGLVNLAALATTCEYSPLLFLGVYGHDQFFSGTAHSTRRSNSLWFLAIDINRIGEDKLKTYLPYFSDFKTENFKNILTSFNDVGINNELLTNIRPACLASLELFDYKSIKLDIELAGGFCSPSASDPSSIAHEVVLGCPKTFVYKGAELKHLPADFTPWTRCISRTCGPVQKADFEVEGSWFRVPRSQEKHILELIAQNPNVICLVKRKTAVGGLVYQVASCGSANQVNHVHYAMPSDSKSSKQLPVQDEPMTIIGAKYDGKTLQVSLDCVGSFFIPKSIATKLKDRFVEQQDIVDFLASELPGYKVLHQESRSGYVRGNTNKEEFLSILDRSLCEVASNISSGIKRLNDGSQDSVCTKRQRIS